MIYFAQDWAKYIMKEIIYNIGCRGRRYDLRVPSAT